MPAAPRTRVRRNWIRRGPVLLYFASRPTGWALLVYAAVGVLTYLVGEATLPTVAAAGTGPPPAPAPILAASPLATATAFSLCVVGGMAQWEAEAARPMAGLRLLNVLAHLAATGLCLYPAASRSGFESAERLVTENVLASVTLVLILAILNRAAHSWLVLYTYGMVGHHGLPPLARLGVRKFRGERSRRRSPDLDCRSPLRGLLGLVHLVAAPGGAAATLIVFPPRSALSASNRQVVHATSDERP